MPFDVGGVVAGDTTLRPPLSRARADQGEAARRLHGQARRRQGRGRSRAPRADHPDRRQDAGVRAGPRAGRGRRLAGRGRGPGRMAGGADGRVRQVVPRHPRRGHPRHHPQQPEMLRGARSENGEAHQQVRHGVEHRGERRRQGHRRRLRARHPRAVVGCEVLLRHRSEDAAGRPPAEVRAHRVPRKARHPGRAHRAHRRAGGPSRADRRRRCRQGRARGAALQGRSR